MEPPESRDLRVRPEFAVVVFGLPGAVCFWVTAKVSTTPYEYLTGFSWALSFLLLAGRGFRNEQRDAFAPVTLAATNWAPALLGLASLGAIQRSEPVPEVLLPVLAVAWTVAAPWWRRQWQAFARTAVARYLVNTLAIVDGLAAIALLAVIAWAFFVD